MPAKYQFDLAAGILTDIFTCPADRSVSITVYLSNRGSETTFCMSLAIEGEADSPKQYIYYDSTLPANDTLKESITLSKNDVLRVKAEDGHASANVFVDRINSVI